MNDIKNRAIELGLDFDNLNIYEKFLFDSFIEVVAINNNLRNENKQLKEILLDYHKALEFYSKPNGSRVVKYTTHTMYKDDIETHNDAGWLLKLKGKTARQALSKHSKHIKAIIGTKDE